MIAGPGHAARPGRHRPGGPGRARARRAGLAGHLVGGGGRGGRPPRSTAWSQRSPRRADLEATLGRRRLRRAGRRAGAGLCGGQRGRPRAPRDPHRRRRVAAAAGRRRPAPCSSGRCRRPASATTWPGPTTCCPTNRTARFASALRVDDFRRHIHAVTRRRRSALEALGPHVVTLAETEGLAAHAESVRLRWPRLGPGSAPGPARGPSRPGRARPATTRPRSRSRSGSTPTSRRCRRRPSGSRPSATASAAIEFNRYPDRDAAELRRALADSHGVRPEQVFCANGSNEVLQSPAAGLRRARADGGAVRADLHAAPPHRPDHRHRRWRPGGRTDDFRLDLDEVAAGGRCPRPGDHLPVLAQQPDRPGRPARADRSGGRRSPRAWWWSTRPTGSSPRRRRSTCVRAGGPGTDRLVVVRTFSKTWSMAGLRLGYLVGRPRGGRGLRAGGPAVPPRRGQAAGRTPGPRLRRRDGDTGGDARRGAGPDRRRLGRPAGRDAGRRTPTSSCSGRPATTADEVWPTSSTLGARAGLFDVAGPRRLPAGHRRAPRRRTTASWPP